MSKFWVTILNTQGNIHSKCWTFHSWYNMSSTRKSTQSDKKNYSNEEELALGDLVEKYKKEYDDEVNWMTRKQGKQKRREHLCCLFIGCIFFKFVNLLYGAYPKFTHSVFCFSFQVWCKKKEAHPFSNPPPPNPPHRLLIFGKFSNPPYICDQRVYIKCYLHYKTILCHKVVLDV